MIDTYQPPVFDAPIDLDLSRNEGIPSITDIDISPEELAAVTSRYPDTTRLTEVVAARHGVSTRNVLVTAGGDDALFRCFLANAGQPVISTTPSFEMIRRYAAQVGSPLTEVPWWDGDFPIDDFLEAGANTRMAVIVSPNNPTGSVITQSDLRKVAGSVPLLVLDAAYADFADEDLTAVAEELDNVVVTRTLSKAFGLAGLRVGYLLATDDMVTRLAGYGSPYSMSSLSAALATDVLTNQPERPADFSASVAPERERLIEILDELGCRPLASQANFVLATNVAPSWVVPAAASLGVGLRRFPGSEDLSRSVRITLPGEDGRFARLEETLRAVLAPEALLFDMDGVLADVSMSFRAAIVATAAGFGVEVTDADIAEVKALGDASDDWEVTRRLCAAAGVDVAFETVRDAFEKIYQGTDERPGFKEEETLLADVARLEAWADRMPLGIVTARPRKDAQEFLERFDVGRFFTAVITREDAPSKPDPAPVILALKRLGVRRAWMAGDTVDDLSAARAAGAVPIGIATNDEDPAVLRGAARVLTSVNEIEEIFDATRV